MAWPRLCTPAPTPSISARTPADRLFSPQQRIGASAGHSAVLRLPAGAPLLSSPSLACPAVALASQISGPEPPAFLFSTSSRRACCRCIVLGGLGISVAHCPAMASGSLIHCIDESSNCYRVWGRPDPCFVLTSADRHLRSRRHVYSALAAHPLDHFRSCLSGRPFASTSTLPSARRCFTTDH